MNTCDKRFYETSEYDIAHTRNCEKTDNSEDKRKPDKKMFTKNSTKEVTEDKSDKREETEQYESNNLNQRKPIDEERIPDSNVSQNNGDALDNESQIINLSENKTRKEKANSPESQTHETTKAKNKSRKIFKVVYVIKKKKSSKGYEKHDRLSKDNQIIKVCRMGMDSIYKLLKYRCEREGFTLKKVKVRKLFGNILKQRWFVKRKFKYIFATKHANKRVIRKMIKKDLIFKKLVELKFEDFYQKYFMINNRYLPVNEINAIYLQHFESLGKYLDKESEKKPKQYTEEENEQYLKELIITGLCFISDIKGEGYYNPRCIRKKIRRKIFFIMY
jgi:hypothetical protein